MSRQRTDKKHEDGCFKKNGASHAKRKHFSGKKLKLYDIYIPPAAAG